MSDGRRAQRVESEIKHLVGSYLLNGLREPLRGLISVAEVEVTKDFRSAKVFLSYMGAEADKELDSESLEQQRHHIQRHINKELNLKFTPVLKFFFNKAPMSEVDLMIAELRRKR